MSSHTLTAILATWGYAAVFAFVAIDAAGIPFPGETMLIAAAVYAGSGHLLIPVVIVAAAVGATAGFTFSFAVGRTGGRALAYRFGDKVRIKRSHLEKAEKFFNRYGDATVFLGRFVSIGRAFAALLAGIHGMPWAKFMIFNVAGAIAWSCVFGLLGFELGHNLPILHRVVQVLGIGSLVAVSLLVLAVLCWRYRRQIFRLIARSEDA